MSAPASLNSFSFGTGVPLGFSGQDYKYFNLDATIGRLKSSSQSLGLRTELARLARKGVDIDPGSITTVLYWQIGLEESSEGCQWTSPHISVSEFGEVTFEWWNKKRKITVYFTSKRVLLLRVWGWQIETEMEEFELSRTSDFAQHWRWLWS